jgi:hypothetical protein
MLIFIKIDLNAPAAAISVPPTSLNVPLVSALITRAFDSQHFS